MAKSKEQYIEELKQLDLNMKVTDDHNVDDIRNMIELVNLRNEKAEWGKEKATYEKSLADLKSQNAAVVKSNKELQERLEKSEDEQRGPAKLPKFKRDKEEYQFTSPTFELNGQKYDVRPGGKPVPAEVLNHLVKIRSGVIRKIEK